jgi:hypothetical protein
VVAGRTLRSWHGFGLTELVSEDFEHNRTYGTVRVVDPFAEAP